MIIFTDMQSAQMPLDQVILEVIKKYKPSAVYFRDKHLTNSEYCELAKKIMAICALYDVDFFVCHRADVAIELGVKNLHTNVNNLSKIGTKSYFRQISVAIHSVEEVKQAQSLGATSLVFGHIFQTNCKAGIAPRGIEQLSEICNNSNLPVVAIGGITSKNYEQVLSAGANDFAIMSSAMTLTF